MSKELVKGKRGQAFDAVTAMVIGLAGMVITFAVVFLIMANVAGNSQVGASANATLAVNKTIAATADIPDWIPLIVIAMIGAILLGLVAMFRR